MQINVPNTWLWYQSRSQTTDSAGVWAWDYTLVHRYQPEMLLEGERGGPRVQSSPPSVRNPNLITWPAKKGMLPSPYFLSVVIFILAGGLEYEKDSEPNFLSTVFMVADEFQLCLVNFHNIA